MKKSFAITTIIALHAALIGGMLIQGCSSEPADTQPAKAKTTVEEINPAQPEEQAQPAAAETKEVIPPEGSSALRAAPTRPAWNMGKSNEEIVPADKPVEPQKPVANELVKPVEKDPNLVSYTVQRGDSLAKIAKKHNVSLDKVLKINGLTRTTVIQVGQEISLPAPDKNTEVVPATPVAPKIESAVETDEVAVYVVQKGDSLGRLARKFDTSVKHLMAINGLKNHNIKIGQKLNVSKKALAQSAEKAPKAGKQQKGLELAAGEVEHVVKSGETLGLIALKYKTSVKAIMERNSIKDARKLRVGQKLAIASKAAPKGDAAKPAAKSEPKVEAQKPAAPVIPVAKDVPAQPATNAAPAPTVVPETPAQPAPTAPAQPAPAQSETESLPVVEL